MKTEIDTFRKIHNSALIGFDELFHKIKELETQKSGFPPYDIIKHSNEDFSIKMAVAGYTKDNIKVELNSGKLTVSGSLDKLNHEYIYKGIAERDFSRLFTLADTVEVSGVTLSDGILLIGLKNIIPESKKYKLFDIK
jgi:molecular chaperone IbpA